MAAKTMAVCGACFAGEPIKKSRRKQNYELEKALLPPQGQAFFRGSLALKHYVYAFPIHNIGAPY